MSPITMPFAGAGPLVLFLAKATVLLVAALVATMTLRRSTAGARHLVWLAALVGVLALPVLSRIQSLQFGVLPSSLGMLTPGASREVAEVAVPAVPAIATLTAVAPVPAIAVLPATPRPARMSRRAIAAAPSIALHPAITTTRPARAPRAAMIATVAIAAPPVSMDISGPWDYSLLSTIAFVWGAVALALTGWLVAGAISVRRIIKLARELTSPDWTMPLCEVADRLDLELPPRLVLSDRIEMAFACRALAPTIVLPAAAESWTDDRRRAVLFHELAHVKRHDLLGHTLGRVACALYWFHPLVWTAAKHLRAESERACDDLVLSCGARPSEYAQHLLDMVTSVRNHGAPIMALPMARKKEFEGRMLAILDPAIRRASPGRLQAVGLIATLAILSVTVAAVAPATASPVEVSASEMPVAAIATMTPAPSARSPKAQMPQDVPLPAALPSPRPVTRTEVETSTAKSSNLELKSLDAIVNMVTRETVGAVGSAFQRLGNQISGQQLVRQGGDTGRVAALIRVLETDTDASVRKTAAWGLNEVQAPNVRAVLTKVLRSDADAAVREMAAWALSEQGKDEAAPALADALLHDKSAHVRSTAAWGLGELNAKTEASALESGILDPDIDVRETSIWALGQLDLRTAPRALVNALTDNSKRVRLVTAWALGEMEDKSTVQAIVNAFQTETDSEVRGAELRALAMMDATSPAVVDIALKSSDPELRKRAVSMLAGHGAGIAPWPWPWPRPRPFP